jgi:hypothetical protein
MSHKNLIFLCLMLAITLVSSAETSKTFYLSLWNDLSTDMKEQVDIHHFSLSVLANTEADLNGTGFSILGEKRHNCSGVQFANGANILSGSLRGVQFTAGANIVKKSVFGAQLAVYNQSNKLFGTQFGVVNNSSNIKGAQFGLINLNSKSISGLQFGLINFSDEVHGLQFGLINFANSNEDVAFGLINFIRNGYYSADFWMNEEGIPFAGFRHGTNKFYMEISAGAKELDDPVYWLGGVAFGTRKMLGMVELDFNLGSYNVNDDTLWEVHDLNMLNQFRTSVGFNIYGDLIVYGGITINNFVSKKCDGSELYGSAKIYNHDGSDIFVRSWLGYMVGVRF